MDVLSKAFCGIDELSNDLIRTFRTIKNKSFTLDAVQIVCDVVNGFAKEKVDGFTEEILAYTESCEESGEYIDQAMIQNAQAKCLALDDMIFRMEDSVRQIAAPFDLDDFTIYLDAEFDDPDTNPLTTEQNGYFLLKKIGEILYG